MKLGNNAQHRKMNLPNLESRTQHCARKSNLRMFYSNDLNSLIPMKLMAITVTVLYSQVTWFTDDTNATEVYNHILLRTDEEKCEDY